MKSSFSNGGWILSKLFIGQMDILEMVLGQRVSGRAIVEMGGDLMNINLTAQ